MDGTLTAPVLDFALIRSRLGLQPDEDILHVIHSWTGQRRQEADRILLEVEREAMLAMQIQEGLHELMEVAHQRDAILTRNQLEPVTHLLEHHAKYAFHPILTRAFTPVKPDPAPLFHIAQQW
ncbi:hypothetical protein HK104_005462, partial [Borealophlyctis nickersoniae]